MRSNWSACSRYSAIIFTVLDRLALEWWVSLCAICRPKSELNRKERNPAGLPVTNAPGPVAFHMMNTSWFK